MNLPQGSAFAICAGLGLIVGLVMDEIAWGLIIGAAVGALTEAWSVSQRNKP